MENANVSNNQIKKLFYTCHATWNKNLKENFS